MDRLILVVMKLHKLPTICSWTPQRCKVRLIIEDTDADPGTNQNTAVWIGDEQVFFRMNFSMVAGYLTGGILLVPPKSVSVPVNS